MSTPSWFAEALPALLARRDLTATQVEAALTAMVEGRCGDAEAAAFLTALRAKGETAGEMAAAARVLRRHMRAWDPGRPVLDTCGTGGDGACTFNISTTAAFVAAAAGVPVVKHGNRSVSSRCGSADLLAALGVELVADGAAARQALDRCGLAFCFAPNFHPALKHLADVRRRLGFATLFNWLGPLTNPAGASHQLLGVGRPELLDLVAGALAQLGTTRALVVCGCDGLDEVSLSAPTQVREVCGGAVRAWEWTPADFGLEPCTLAELTVGSVGEGAAVVRRVLACEPGPATRIVLANTAAALIAAGRADSPREGVALAAEALASGRAAAVLARLARA